MTMWQPIDTAPLAGEFLVRGGERVNALDSPEPLVGIAHVAVSRGEYRVRNTCYYAVMITNPTYWHPLP